MKFRILIVLIPLWFAACDFQATIELPFSHVIRVLQSRGEGIPATAEIRMEMAGLDACNEKKGKALEILSRYYGESESSRCIQEGVSTFLIARVPLAVSRKGLVRDKKITSILIEQNEQGIQLRVAMDPGSFQRMQQEMMDAFFQKPEIEDLMVLLRFHNDGKSSLISKARFVYVDDKPMPMDSKVILDPGRTIEVRLSDVARDYIYSNGSLAVLSIEKTVDGKAFTEIEFMQADKANPEPESRPTDLEDKGKDETAETRVDPRLKEKDFPELEQKIQEIIKKDALGTPDSKDLGGM
ncbi:MAG: hypothetical protein RH862_11635 [Leptospiraceae bacterium]